MTPSSSPSEALRSLLRVVINAELQYSCWPLVEDVPAGWADVGFWGSEEDCLNRIGELWLDMRPTSLRIHCESLRRTSASPWTESGWKSSRQLQGFRATDWDGLPFRSKRAGLRHLSAREVVASPGQFLHLSLTLEDAVANGVAAATWDPRYSDSLGKLFEEGMFLFKVEADRGDRGPGSLARASRLDVGDRVPLASSCLWQLLQAGVEKA